MLCSYNSLNTDVIAAGDFGTLGSSFQFCNIATRRLGYACLPSRHPPRRKVHFCDCNWCSHTCLLQDSVCQQLRITKIELIVLSFRHTRTHHTGRSTRTSCPRLGAAGSSFLLQEVLPQLRQTLLTARTRDTASSIHVVILQSRQSWRAWRFMHHRCSR